jgi:hypothetical protein
MMLFIVSNRQPVTFSEDKGNYNPNKSSGGLASGISSCLSSGNSSSPDKYGYNRVGSPGLSFYKAYNELSVHVLLTHI